MFRILRTCNKCKEEKEVNLFNFGVKNNKHKTICRECERKYAREYLKSHYKNKQVDYDADVYINCRVKMGLTQFEVSVKSGINYHTYCSVERSVNKTISKATKVKLDKFYNLEG